MLLSFLSYLSDYPDIAKKLSKDEKKQLSIFVATYLGDLTGDRLQEMMKELKSLPEKFKNFWADNVGFMESVVNFILKSYELEKIDLPDIKNEEKRLSETYKHQMEMLLKLVEKLGFQSIYILVDRIDETEQTGNDPEASYRLIQPLIKDLELLGLKGYGFKFFLWDKIEPYYRDDARPDRIAQYNLNWTRTTLKNVLSKRLIAFSNGNIQNIQNLVSEPSDIDIDDSISLMAGQSPRNLIRICEQILATQAERNQESSKIDIQAVDLGIVNFSEILCREIYGDELIKSIQKIGRELFTINYVANDILKISVQAARSKINTWAQTGLVKQVGTISIPSSNRPVHFYCVIEPAAVRLIHRTVDFVTFIKDRWLPCKHCTTDNLINIDLYPDENSASCRNCGRDLV